MSEKAYVHFHGNCFDGSMAAAVFRHANGLSQRYDAEYQPLDYGCAIVNFNKFDGRDVFFLDITLPTEVLNEIAAVANSVTVIDHHPKAREQAASRITEPGIFAANVLFVTDSDDAPQSGAQLVWNFYMDGKPQPDCVRWIGKGDLFLFDEEQIRPLRRGVGTIGFDSAIWQSLLLDDEDGAQRLLAKGRVIEGAVESQLDFLERNCCSRMTIGGYNVIAVDAPKFLASEIAERLYTKTPIDQSEFIAVHYEMNGLLTYSLRSHRDSQLDLDEFCKQFGGGGHFHAAGFTVKVQKTPIDPPAAEPTVLSDDYNIFGAICTFFRKKA